MIIEGLTGAPIGLIFGTLGTQELLIIFLIAVLIFGGRKIPEIFRGFGEGIKEFKKSMKDDDKPAEKPDFRSEATEEREKVKS